MAILRVCVRRVRGFYVVQFCCSLQGTTNGEFLELLSLSWLQARAARQSYKVDSLAHFG
jgi:hypothetical protein